MTNPLTPERLEEAKRFPHIKHNSSHLSDLLDWFCENEDTIKAALEFAQQMQWNYNMDETPEDGSLYEIWDESFNAPLLCKYDLEDDKAYSATQAETEVYGPYLEFNCDAGNTRCWRHLTPPQEAQRS